MITFLLFLILVVLLLKFLPGVVGAILSVLALLIFMIMAPNAFIFIGYFLGGLLTLAFVFSTVANIYRLVTGKNLIETKETA